MKEKKEKKKIPCGDFIEQFPIFIKALLLKTLQDNTAPFIPQTFVTCQTFY